MKLLTVSILLCALLALSFAADSQVTPTQAPQAEQAATEAAEEETLVAEEAPTEAAQEAAQEEEKEEPESDAGISSTSEPSRVVKRATSCPSGWTLYRSRCFRYFSYAYSWAQAESFCTSQGGNLATAPTNSDYDWLRSYSYSQARTYRLIWIGGSDAQQDRLWLWSDGSRFYFRDWCNSGPPSSGTYNCLAMNHSRCYCGAALPCNNRYPFICVRK